MCAVGLRTLAPLVSAASALMNTHYILIIVAVSVAMSLPVTVATSNMDMLDQPSERRCSLHPCYTFTDNTKYSHLIVDTHVCAVGCGRLLHRFQQQAPS